MFRPLLLAALVTGLAPLPAPAQTLVRAVSVAPAPFADEIAAFEAADRMAMPASGGVLFLGSSSIRFWSTLVEDFPGVPVINRGFGGSLIADSLHYADRIALPYAPRTIVFYAGDNDIAAGRTPAQILADFQALVTHVHARLPQTRILFISIKPSILRWPTIDRIREANRLIRAYTAASPMLGFVDITPAMLGPDGRPRPELFRPDRLHMTRAGYAIWRDAVAPYLKP
jgi:lysophospholipase L1-like esterase